VAGFVQPTMPSGSVMEFDSRAAVARVLVDGDDEPVTASILCTMPLLRGSRVKLLLMPPNLGLARQGLLDALGTGQLPRERLVEAVTRILALKLALNGYQRPASSTVDSPANRDAAAAVSNAAVTVFAGACSGPLVAGPVRITAASGRTQPAQWLAEALGRRGVTVVPTGGQRIHLVGYGDDAGDLAHDAAVTVSMDTPYVLASATSPVRIATYSSTQASMEALAAVLAGAAHATGRSPVTVAGLPASACAG